MGEDGRLQIKERDREQILLLQPSEGTTPAYTSILDLQASETGRKINFC